MKGPSLPRRHFIGGLAAVSGSVVSPGFAKHVSSFTFVTAEVPPYSVPGPNGRTGFVIEIVQELVARLDAEITIVSYPWKRAITTLRGGTGIFMAPLARTPLREKSFQWVFPIFSEEVRLFGIDGAEPLNITDARNLQGVAVMAGSAMEELGLNLGLSNLSIAPDSFSASRMLVFKHADAIISLRSLAIHSMEAQGFDPARLVPGEVLDRYDVSIAASLDTPEGIINEMRQAFQTMKEDGSVDGILKKYGVRD